MPLIRGHHSFDDHFTQIPNDWLRDTRLSLKAIGLLAQIMSHTPGWRMSIRSLAKVNGTGQDTIKSAILELEKFGYLVRSSEQGHNEDGTFADYDFKTQDPFQNPVTAKPRHGETGHKEEHNSIEEQEIKNNQRIQSEKLFDEFWKEYPRKEGKKPAFKAFRSALSRASFEDIIAGVIAYRSSDRVRRGFIKLPATFLNEDAWEDAATHNQIQEFGSERRAKDLSATEQYLAEMEKLKTQAAPPPKCRHGKNLALCSVCVGG
jgi:hypothetical protein